MILDIVRREEGMSNVETAIRLTAVSSVRTTSASGQTMDSTCHGPPRQQGLSW